MQVRSPIFGTKVHDVRSVFEFISSLNAFACDVNLCHVQQEHAKRSILASMRRHVAYFAWRELRDESECSVP